MMRLVALVSLFAFTSALQLQRDDDSPGASEKPPVEFGRMHRPSKYLPQKFEILRQEELKKNCSGGPRYTDMKWQSLNPNILKTWMPHSQPVKLVLGIHAQTERPELHEAHRNTWMKQPGVCTIDRWDDPSCHTFPLFLFANIANTNFVHLASAKDTLILSDVPEPKDKSKSGLSDDASPGITEDMQYSMHLKTISWFDYAAKNFKWATHVGKMDLDTYPRLQCIQNDLSEARFKDYPIYYGHKHGGGYAGKGLMMGEFQVMSNTLTSCLVQYNTEHAIKKDAKNFQKLPDWLQDWLTSSNLKVEEEWLSYTDDQVTMVLLNRALETKVCPEWVDVQRGENRWKHPV